jgi:DNA-binding NarL/FixJ family response regulator
MDEEPVRVLIADDHPMLRKGLRLTIEEDPGLRVVGEAPDGEIALALITKLRPDVAVLDIEMPKLDGLSVAREAIRLGFAVKTIFLTLHLDEDMFRAAVEMGSKGYILKDSAAQEIVAGVRSVAAGRPYVEPRRHRQGIQAQPRRSPLSHRTTHHAIDRQWKIQQRDWRGPLHPLPHGGEPSHQYMS